MLPTNILPNAWVGGLKVQIRCFWAGISLFFCHLMACSPPDYSANDVVPPLPGNFDYGVNMGYFPPFFDDISLARLAQACGATSIRPGLFHHFLENNGYESRLREFQYYQQAGLRNVVAILGFPHPDVRDTSRYCREQNSEVFAGLYEPIWDNGAHGTPVNEQNPYALYVWKASQTYRGLIKIYEVWNEPDYGDGKGMLGPGQAGNWWENAPQPCDTRLKAPVFYYIRMLRITYEIVKKNDPDALIAVGGLGWPSYLDALCRYTDEPLAGKPDGQHYPLKGGAYFDCMSFHVYPHLGYLMQKKPDSTGRQVYARHSDAAVQGVWDLQKQFAAVLEGHGYNDQIYPKKHWICTEFNIPRVQYGEYIGSESAQINFLIKTLAGAQMRGVAQMHLYSLADEKNETNPEFSTMGLYENLVNVPTDSARVHLLAAALKTTTECLHEAVFDPVRTTLLRLPKTVAGAAFRDKNGRFVYILWAKTLADQNESAQAGYSFPAGIVGNKLQLKNWDYSLSRQVFEVDAQHIQLTASPVFIAE
jgi:hypothetical protein